MPNIKVLDQTGAEVKRIKLDDEVFGVEPNMPVVYQVVNAERASNRQGTAKTKGRSEVSGGGRKPWRQKGTGRARQGTIRAPQWRGGGIVFGPTPRSYRVKVNRKVVKLAFKSLLSDRLNNEKLIIVDKFNLESYKTKEAVQILNNLNVNGKAVIITGEEDYNLFTASRNIEGIYAQTKDHLSVYDLINADTYVLTLDAVKKYEEDLK